MDFEFWLRLGKNYKFLHVKKILAGNRVHRMRKRIAGGKDAEREDKKIVKEYGQTFGAKYYLLHYMLDLPCIQFSKFLGVKEILNLRKKSDALTFDGKYSNVISLIFTQVSPQIILIWSGKI
jgi:hypothetical protein